MRLGAATGRPWAGGRTQLRRAKHARPAGESHGRPKYSKICIAVFPQGARARKTQCSAQSCRGLVRPILGGMRSAGGDLALSSEPCAAHAQPQGREQLIRRKAWHPSQPARPCKPRQGGPCACTALSQRAAGRHAYLSRQAAAPARQLAPCQQ